MQQDSERSVQNEANWVDIEPKSLIVDLTGYSGPLDLLLELARQQRVDLTQISILELVDQYLAFIAKAKSLNINLAADYLVMAAWLALLKSRLLLPLEKEQEATAKEIATHLAWRMQRLNAMHNAGKKLLTRNQLNIAFFPRGQAETITIHRKFKHTTTLYNLLQAYIRINSYDQFRPLYLDKPMVVSVEEAINNLKMIVGTKTGWVDLASLLPSRWKLVPLQKRSATASTLVASLELARQGKIDIRQATLESPVEIRYRAQPRAY